MNIRFTNIVWDDLSNVLNQAIVPLEFVFNSIFEDKSYGGDVSQFAAIAIVVGSPEENKKFATSNDKSGSNKHPLTSETIKFISFALCFNPEDIKGLNEKQFSKVFCHALKERLDIPAIKIPKGFNYEKFSLDMKDVLIKLLQED